jgi:HSP20 family protein
MASITRYDPFEDFFKGFWMKPVSLPAQKGFTVKADIPGVKKEDIQVDIDDDRISLRAEVKHEKEEKKDEKLVYSERSYGMVSRSFTLPADVDAKGAKAEYKDGVLNLTLPKKSNGPAKRISVS